MKSIARFIAVAALGGLIATPAALAGMNDEPSHMPGDMMDDPSDVPDRPSTMPDELDRDEGRDLLDDGDAAGDAPLDDDLDPRRDDLTDDPLDEPANIPDPGM